MGMVICLFMVWLYAYLKTVPRCNYFCTPVETRSKTVLLAACNLVEFVGKMTNNINFMKSGVWSANMGEKEEIDKEMSKMETCVIEMSRSPAVRHEDTLLTSCSSFM